MKKRSILSAALVGALCLGLSAPAFAEELSLNEQYSLEGESTWVKEDITLYRVENEYVYVDESDGYHAIAGGTPLTVTNVGEENDYVHVFYEPYTMQTESMLLYVGTGAWTPNDEEIGLANVINGNRQFKGDYLCYNDGLTCAYYLNQDGGWSELESAILDMNYMGQASERDTYANALSGLFLKPGESATFTLPDDGTDTFYLLWVVSTNLDTGNIRWQYSEFKNVEAAPTVDTVTGFTDVSENDYYADAVLWARDAGVTSGTGNGQFSPDSTITRAEAVTLLWRAAGSPAPKSGSSPFSDVKDTSAYYYDAVLWAAENSITGGTGGNRFGRDGTLTYDQIFSFLRRAAGEDNGNGGLTWSEAAVAWAEENGLTDGLSYAPEDPCSRADLVYCMWKQMA